MYHGDYEKDDNYPFGIKINYKTNEMQETMTPELRNKLKEVLETCIKETNRCLYAWNHGTPHRAPKNTRDVTAIKGLFNNWMARGLKGLLGWRSLRSMFRDGRPSITIDATHYYVTGIYFPVYDEHIRRTGYEVECIKDIILKEINFKSLQFKPSTGIYGKDNSQLLIPKSTLVDEQKREIFHQDLKGFSDTLHDPLKELKDLDFSTISNIKP